MARTGSASVWASSDNDELGAHLAEHATRLDRDRDALAQDVDEAFELRSAAGDEQSIDPRSLRLRRVELEGRPDLVDELRGPLHRDLVRLLSA